MSNSTEIEQVPDSTIEIISNLFGHIDTISLPIFLIIFIILEIYKLVKENSHFDKKYKLKKESINVSNGLTNTVLQETISAHNTTELVKSKINEMSKQNVSIKPVSNIMLNNENNPTIQTQPQVTSLPLVLDITSVKPN